MPEPRLHSGFRIEVRNEAHRHKSPSAVANRQAAAGGALAAGSLPAFDRNTCAPVGKFQDFLVAARWHRIDTDNDVRSDVRSDIRNDVRDPGNRGLT
jgi:hypothetical protein